jgi:hypothetical protein
MKKQEPPDDVSHWKKHLGKKTEIALQEPSHLPLAYQFSEYATNNATYKTVGFEEKLGQDQKQNKTLEHWLSSQNVDVQEWDAVNLNEINDDVLSGKVKIKENAWRPTLQRHYATARLWDKTTRCV